MAKGLTDKQRRILEYIIDFQREHSFPPTIRELCEAFEIGSLRGVTVHLEALARKNYITRVKHTSRSIRVLTPDPRDPQDAQKPETSVRLPLVRSLPEKDEETINDKIAGEAEIERYIAIPEELVAPATPAGFIIRVGATGIPGEPVLPGDLLVARPQQRSLAGEMVVIRTHGDLYALRATGANMDSDVSEKQEVVGRVIGLIRRY
jgi:repressor LexA